MKRFVKADSIPHHSSYFTAGKWYEAHAASDTDKHLFRVVDDEGRENFVRTDYCSHLDGEPWEVKTEE